MLFSDLFFIFIFLPILFLLYYPINNLHWRNGVLIVFSLFFYAWGEPVFVLLMLGTVTVNYLCGLIISHFSSFEKGNKAKICAKICLIAAVVINIGALAYFKYTGFFLSSLNSLFGSTFPIPQIALPLGISFFTFQSLSYTIDVYRGDTPVQKNFFRLLLYVSLFPQLIAGPIVRYRDICAQLRERTISLEKINDGIFRFSAGLAKKVLIANPCGAAASALLDSPLSEATAASAWIGILFYSMQIYFDFSGYSDMAIGLGKMLGFDFLENFNYPYISKSATEFWRRWHMSLGSFFRDYVYIPLGGNRRMWLRNVLAVWLLTGLWHGAAFNFICWGLYYALLLLLEKKLLLPALQKLPSAAEKIISHIYAIIITLIGWTMFYYTDDLLPRLGKLFGIGAPLGDIYELSILRSNIFLLITAIILSTPLISSLMKRIFRDENYSAKRIAKTVFALCAVFLCTVMLAGNTYNPFLYFRF